MLVHRYEWYLIVFLQYSTDISAFNDLHVLAKPILQVTLRDHQYTVFQCPTEWFYCTNFLTTLPIHTGTIEV